MSVDIANLVAAVQVCGGSVRRLGDGKVSLVGSVTDDVLAAVRANKEAFLEAWEEDRRTRYLRTPPESLLLRTKPTNWRVETRKRVESYALAQGGEIARWVLLRAAAYRQVNPAWREADAASAALCDLLHWQFSDRHDAPEQILHTIDEVLRW